MAPLIVKMAPRGSMWTTLGNPGLVYDFYTHLIVAYWYIMAFCSVVNNIFVDLRYTSRIHRYTIFLWRHNSIFWFRHNLQVYDFESTATFKNMAHGDDETWDDKALNRTKTYNQKEGLHCYVYSRRSGYRDNRHTIFGAATGKCLLKGNYLPGTRHLK